MTDNIPCFPGYHITRDGQLFSKRHSNGKEWRKRKLSYKKTYVEVKVYQDQKPKSIGLHRLVLLAYVGLPPTNQHECRHLDGNPHNNHINNLTWGTKKENKQDQFVHGTGNRGEKCLSSKLTEDQVKEIFQSTERTCDLMTKFGINRTSVVNIRLGISWKHVTDKLYNSPSNLKNINMIQLNIVHCKKAPFDVYIGRPKTGYSWGYGNPFSIGYDGNREEVIKKYESWLKTGNNFGNGNAKQERRQWILDHIHELKNKTVGCWCSFPKEDCHGRILLELANELTP